MAQRMQRRPSATQARRWAATLAGSWPGLLLALCVLLALSLQMAPSLLWAQAPPTAQLPSSDSLKERRQAIDVMADIEPAEKKQLLELIDAAAATIERAERRSEQLEDYKALAARETEILDELDRSGDQPMVELPGPEATLQELQQAQTDIEAQRTSLASRLLVRQTRQRLLQTRDAAISGEIDEANKALDTLQDDSALQRVTTLDSLEEARELLDSVKRQERLQAIDDLQAELATIPARQIIVDARIDKLSRQIAALDTQAARMARRIAESEKRDAIDLLAEAGQQVQRAEQEAPSLVNSAQRNQELARELLGLSNDELPDSNSLRKEVRRIGEVRDTVRRILDNRVISDTVATLLRELRTDLPGADLLDQQISASEHERTELELRIIVWQELERGVKAGGDEADLASSISAAHAELLRALIERAQTMIGAMRLHETLLSDALRRTTSLNTLLDRNSLWLRTSEPVTQAWFWNLGPGVLWLIDPASWQGALDTLTNQLLRHPWESLALLLFATYLITRRRALNRRLDLLAASVGRVGEDTYGSTPFAITISGLLALPLPFVIGWAAFLLGSGGSDSPFESALASSLKALSVILFMLLLFRAMCRTDGVFAAHFGWSERARKSLRKHLTWFSAWQGICTLVFVLAVDSGDLSLRYGIATLAFIISSLGIAAFGYVVFRPIKGIAYRIFEITDASLFGYLLCFLLVTLPLVIGLMPLLGYFDTAVELQSRVFSSGVLLVIAVVVYGLLVRYYMVAQRRFALSRARRKLQRARAARLAGAPDAAGDAVPTGSLYETVDQEAIDNQTRNLLRVVSAVLLIGGLLFIWRNFLPALGVAQDIILWQSASVLDGTVSVEPVSLWNLILAFGLIVGSVVLIRNIRGPLEVGVFERMKLAPGERYAAITIIGYVLFGVGLVGGLSQLGIDWSKLQWIVAALGVGLGFGLQEIVANFVSGLILLFERPIRIGDTVTIGETTGTVRNIRIRATTITDFDNRDVTIPNNSVTTENVVNWTLHDPVTRLRLHVNVAHHADVEQVQALIMQVLEAHPDVVEEPPPAAFFIGYSDSAMQFDILVFFDSPMKFLPLTHDINMGVNQALQRAGLQIPYPRREIHMAEHQESKPAPGQSG